MARRAFDLPECFAAMHAGLGLLSHPRLTRVARRLDKIQRSDFRQRRQFGFLQARHAQLQIVDGTKRPQRTLAHNFPGNLFTQAFDVTHSQTQREALAVFFEMAGPIRACHVDGPDFQPVPLRVLDDRGRMIKTHGLVIQKRRGKRRQIAALQIRAGISQQGEARRVRFREAVQRKGDDRLHDFLLRLRIDPIALHAPPEFYLHIFHARFGALEAKGAAQLFRFAAGESRGDHGHAQQLFLKKRHAQGPRENRLQRRMQAIGRLASLAALQIGMHHFAHDGPRPDDGHLHHDVVKTGGAQARQASHLRAALDLKHAHGIGFLQRIVNDGIVGGQPSQIDLFAVIFFE